MQEKGSYNLVTIKKIVTKRVVTGYALRLAR
jgi:hypothetical protein